MYVINFMHHLERNETLSEIGEIMQFVVFSTCLCKHCFGAVSITYSSVIELQQTDSHWDIVSPFSVDAQMQR